MFRDLANSLLELVECETAAMVGGTARDEITDNIDTAMADVGITRKVQPSEIWFKNLPQCGPHQTIL
jgi:hypothetical protein